MGKLADLVSKSPSLMLGAAVARLPRLRPKDSSEAWLITRVRPAKGGGHPTVYGLRMSLSWDGVNPSSAQLSANSSGSGSGSGSSSGSSSSDEGTRRLKFAAQDRVIRGPLKGDWTVVAGPAAASGSAEAAAVRTNVGLSLRPELLARARGQQAPFDALRAAFLARSGAEHALALKEVQEAAAAAEAAAAEAAAAAAAASAEGAKA